MLEIQIAIIDDDADQACSFSELIPKWLAEERSQLTDLTETFEFSVQAIYPHSLEEGKDFIDRVKQFLLCEAPFVRYGRTSATPPTSLDDIRALDKISSEALQVVILDHHLMPANRAEVDRTTGTDLAEFVRRHRPNVQRLLLSNHNDTEWDRAPLSTLEAFFSKYKLLQFSNERIRLAKVIYSRLKDRMSVPYWGGLQEYVDTPKIVMHAMAITDAGSLVRSGTARQFLEYFGSHMFVAEASLVLKPLDSIFSPTESLKKSLPLFAKTFAGEEIGARCYFVTNGTSTSNKIVTEAVTTEGDIVLLDRNCHTSHHYAYVNQGLCPIFLQPDYDGDTDVSAAVSADVLRAALDRLLDAGEASGEIKLPSLITITNCSFDGFLVNPVEIINAVIDCYRRFDVLNRLSETAFLFDEAWFGFAGFHPATVLFSAGHAMRHFNSEKNEHRGRVRIYATNSVHKTMSALRQASTILVADPLFRNEHTPLAARFRQAYSNHITTSPHAAMISSIDIARRQIDIEGAHLLSHAIRSAKRFEYELEDAKSKGEEVARFFRIAKLGHGLGDLKRDPTKILVQVPRSIGGAKMKRLLWEEGQIQVNKFSRNTVLYMFMIGFDEDKVVLLLRKMREVAHKLTMKGLVSGDFETQTQSPSLPSFVAFWSSRGLSPEKESVEKAFLGGYQFGAREVMRGSLAKKIEYASLATLRQAASIFVAAGFVTPYPPGYPVLIPGQVIDPKTLDYLQALDNPEVHGSLKDSQGAITLPVVKVE